MPRKGAIFAGSSALFLCRGMCIAVCVCTAEMERNDAQIDPEARRHACHASAHRRRGLTFAGGLRARPNPASGRAGQGAWGLPEHGVRPRAEAGFPQARAVERSSLGVAMVRDRPLAAASPGRGSWCGAQGSAMSARGLTRPARQRYGGGAFAPARARASHPGSDHARRRRRAPFFVPRQVNGGAVRVPLQRGAGSSVVPRSWLARTVPAAHLQPRMSGGWVHPLHEDHAP